MKSWIMVFLVALCATSVMAQSRGGKKSAKGGVAAATGKTEPNQMLIIKEVTPLGGDGDYELRAPSAAKTEKWKLKINHSDSYEKDDAKGWHYFEVAYRVNKAGTDESGKKLPIVAIPEVEITYAILYDMSASKLVMGQKQNAKKAGGAIGWEDPETLYPLLTETLTYTSITPREHYAAVCVPPSSVAVYGKPIAFSVQIKVDGVQQGEIYTALASGAAVEGKTLDKLVSDGKHNVAWWEIIRNKSEKVFPVRGILRDRSQTPFIMYGDLYYDQVKTN